MSEDNRALTRVSISLENTLLDAFDQLIQAKGYDNRSEALRDLIRARLIREEAKTMRRTLVLAAAFAWVALAASPVNAGVKTKEITFKSGGDEVKGFLAEPDGKGPFPAIVVIQEWWGLTDWVKDNARRLAEQGYVCLAPDLYRGKVTDNPMVARQLLMGLPRDRALRDLKAAVDTLAARDEVDKSRIGCIGWCMGGGYSLQLALRDARVEACYMCYGA